MSNSIRLTQTVQKGGCAAKVAASELRNILSKVQFPKQDKNVLVDGSYFDDAAVYQISSDTAIVQTLDFFTPIVDSPNWFGRIAAANALSDVYAMGGVPKTALAILAFPLGTLSNDVIAAVIQGACDLMSEVGVNFLGGHSIDDETLKFGLSVTGTVSPTQIWSNRKSQLNDHLILTKPLGTGAIAAGLKKNAWQETDIIEVLTSMGQVNQVLDLIDSNEVHAATDITGFGLLGHAKHLAVGSQKTFTFSLSKIPYFQKFPQAIEQSFLTKAHRSNKEYVSDFVDPEFFNSTQIPDWQKLLLLDPQTSGGLLLSVAPDKSESIIKALKARFQFACQIGEVTQNCYPSLTNETHQNSTDKALSRDANLELNLGSNSGANSLINPAVKLPKYIEIKN